MNSSFKKRALSIFSNKRAEEIEAPGGEIMKRMIYIILGIVLGILLWSIFLNLPMFLPP